MNAALNSQKIISTPLSAAVSPTQRTPFSPSPDHYDHPTRPFDDHNPWEDDTPDPDEDFRVDTDRAFRRLRHHYFQKNNSSSCWAQLSGRRSSRKRSSWDSKWTWTGLLGGSGMFTISTRTIRRPAGRNYPPGNAHPGIPIHSPLALSSHLMNPTNVHQGDDVTSPEQLDRVISQLLEQNAGSTAPPPASEAAIRLLQTRNMDKSMMGRAECSICMDNVEIDQEVTVLPCNHWFHRDCITPWLKKHDTCPHCRKGITRPPGEARLSQSEQPPSNSRAFIILPSSGAEGRRNEVLQRPDLCNQRALILYPRSITGPLRSSSLESSNGS